MPPGSQWVQFNPPCDSDLSMAARWGPSEPFPAWTSGPGTKLLVSSASEEPPEPFRHSQFVGKGGGGQERQKNVKPIKTALRLAAVEMMDCWPVVNISCQCDDDRYI
ncbi:unnamed protein product [Merluccius merluccius]